MKYGKKRISSIPNYGKNYHNYRRDNLPEPPQQLDLFPQSLITPKPQLTSIPGVCHKDPNRYRVIFEGRVLGSNLSIDEALKLAKLGYTTERSES